MGDVNIPTCDECGEPMADGGPCGWYCTSTAPHPKHDEAVRALIRANTPVSQTDHSAVVAQKDAELDELRERNADLERAQREFDDYHLICIERDQLTSALEEANAYAADREAHIVTMAKGGEIIIAERDRLRKELEEANRERERLQRQRAEDEVANRVYIDAMTEAQAESAKYLEERDAAQAENVALSQRLGALVSDFDRLTNGTWSRDTSHDVCLLREAQAEAAQLQATLTREQELHREACERAVSATNESARLREDAGRLRANEASTSALIDARKFRDIRKLLGYVEDGSSTAVSISQDDATRDWVVTVGKKMHCAPCLQHALNNAMEALSSKERGDG